ncbi:UDP-3-O-acyl-N-acetylglucosamine deacetylase [Brevirhabdus sp.]|uniref:UDP-3-O-acyl-N-acetylglucosamine deacetylase n=1 Tax=Brevirhabdus sp. TaxID=2004514 RepID=UPI0040596BD9
MQNTIKSKIAFVGNGLHSGNPVRMTVQPAPADHGIVFRRTDVSADRGFIPARWDHVVQSPLCTLLTNAQGVSISTVEHIMAALAGCGVHNALIELRGNEVPIMDGSAKPFVQAILTAGVAPLGAPLVAIEILKPIEVRAGAAVARLAPAPGLSIDFTIDFADPAIGRQSKVLNLANGAFLRELSDSRTFCRQSDVDDMRSRGLALGGTYLNAVVVDGAKVLSPGGLRHGDEAVRHKMLDALGDLMLAGAPVLGRYTGVRAGHAMTNRLLRAVFADPEAYRRVVCTPSMATLLPGAGISKADLLSAA